jgi:hypothetical protein
VLAVLLGAGLAAPRAQAQDPCAAFTWNVAHERALFSGAPKAQTAGRDEPTAPTLLTDTLYELQLSADTGVRFVTAPGKKQHGAGPYAGLVKFSVGAAGTYRVAADQPIWFDVVRRGEQVAAKDFQGHAGCSAPHKIVQFDLPAGAALTLQISGGVNQTVRLTVTSAPTR